MAVTIEVQPTTIKAGWRPIFWQVSSSRYLDTVQAVSSVVNSGFANYQVASNTYLVGDIVTGSGFTGASAAYNVVQTVTAVTGTSVLTDLTFVTGGTGAGTLTRTNKNFQIKCETYAVINAVNTLIGTSRQVAVLVGADYKFQTNPAGHLQSVLEAELLDVPFTTIETPRAKAVKSYTVKFTEEFDDKNGLMKTGDTITSSSKLVVRATLQHSEVQTMDKYLVGVTLGATARFLTNAPKIKKIRIGEDEQLSFVTEVNETLQYALQRYDLGGAPIAMGAFPSSLIVNQSGVIAINSNVFNSANSKIEVWLINNLGVQRSEKRTYIMDYSNYQNPIRFHFENILGGVDSYTMTGSFKKDVTSKRTAFKKLLPNAFTNRERGVTNLGNQIGLAKEIYSEFLSNDTALWLQELLFSTNVFTKGATDVEFTPVNLYTESMPLYDSERITQMKVVYADSNSPQGLNN